METNRLGRTEYKVTRLGLGCYRFTGDFRIPRIDALRLLDRALSLGINYMDTAPQYGAGESEELVGRTLKKHEGKPVFISTKVGHFNQTIVHSFGEDAYRSEEGIRRYCKKIAWG